MRVLIVDDHELFRNGLRFQIAAIDPTIEVVEADTFSDAVRKAGSSPSFDKVFLDVMIPDRLDWREALEAIRARDAPPEAIVMSGSEDPRLVRTAIDLGAAAFIPKSLKGDVLESALRLVLVGGFSIVPIGLGSAFRTSGPDGASAQGSAPVGGEEGNVPLTPRQQEVLEHINAGLSNRRIADAMDLSEATIKMHIGRLFKVLGAQSRTDALAVARRRGIL